MPRARRFLPVDSVVQKVGGQGKQAVSKHRNVPWFLKRPLVFHLTVLVIYVKNNK